MIRAWSASTIAYHNQSRVHISEGIFCRGSSLPMASQAVGNESQQRTREGSTNSAARPTSTMTTMQLHGYAAMSCGSTVQSRTDWIRTEAMENSRVGGSSCSRQFIGLPQRALRVGRHRVQRHHSFSAVIAATTRAVQC